MFCSLVMIVISIIDILGTYVANFYLFSLALSSHFDYTSFSEEDVFGWDFAIVYKSTYGATHLLRIEFS